LLVSGTLRSAALQGHLWRTPENSPFFLMAERATKLHQAVFDWHRRLVESWNSANEA
jgi:hypothetical protein